MFKRFLYVYTLAFGRVIVYMLQSSEYQISKYLKWLWSVRDFKKVAYRKNLELTKPARMLLWAFYASYFFFEATGILTVIFENSNPYWVVAGVSLIFIAPVLTAHLISIPLMLGNLFIIRPAYGKKIKSSTKKFANHPATKIAVAGSYGKTTVKEILLTVLSEGKKVKATPANKNVGISHARFADKLDGSEDILIIEYGEGKPGDVKRFARRTHPTVGVITGVAPAHLDKYKTIKAAARDIFSLADYLNGKPVYVNGDSPDAAGLIKNGNLVYSRDGIADWKVSDVKLSVQNGMSFTLGDNETKLKLKTKLLGRHLIGPLSLAAYLGYVYGLSNKQILDGVAKIEPFEHRMRPYQLAGAWVIDDTYNGNIEGMKAGLSLLGELPAERKIYVTPGLVDQGKAEENVHIELGKAIKEANPDIVVLMKHSVTENIIKGLSGYKGQLKIEEDPLDFYMNLDKFIAAGDLVLMQNDWPDNYN
jgi:UDP-N-acetylmuramoyl-tripeptide--D-alanyl-D-alanine ligase